MKKILLLFLTFIALNVTGQDNDYFKIKEGSFKHISMAVWDDNKEDHRDIDNNPMALFKISTENINDEQRRKLYFTGNRVTEISDKVYKTGAVWIYITAQNSDYLEIRHPDYGITRFYFPESLCDFCTYEMVLQYVPLSEAIVQSNYLIIKSDQADARIFIDDTLVGKQFIHKHFNVGSSHTWRVECDLYRTETGEVEITAEENYIDLKMKPEYGFVNITSVPNLAKVYVDDNYVGDTPYSSEKMNIGNYTIRVEKDEYQSIEKNVVVNDKLTTKESFYLQSNYVDITINADKDSDIYVDNIYKGRGRWEGKLLYGIHDVEARKANHRTVNRNVELVIGETKAITLDAPVPIYGMLEISSNPTEASVYIDGKYCGQTPMQLAQIIIGNHELKLEKQGCASLTKTITIKQGETLTLDESLQTGKEITITTDKAGDKIYIDGDYVGESPVKTNLSYGGHELKAERDKQVATKKITVSLYGTETYHKLAFGKLITITSNNKGDNVYIEGKKVGSTPYTADIPLGSYTIEVKRGHAEESKEVTVTKDSPSHYYFNPKKESLWSYIFDEGIHFITVDGALTAPSTKSFGLTYGNTGEYDCGWYVSAMTNLNYKSVNKENDGFVTLNGNSSLARLSIMGGVIVNFGGGPSIFNLRFGGGYGMRILYYEDTNGNWYKGAYNTHYGIDLSTGVQLNLRHITISADFVTTNFKTAELKLGVGVNMKR